MSFGQDFSNLVKFILLKSLDKDNWHSFEETQMTAGSERLIHATAETNPSFKAGDRVNVSYAGWTNWFTPGEIYTIRGIDRHYHVTFLEVPYKAHISELSHAKPQPKPLTRAMVVERAKEYVEEKCQ